VAAAVPPPLVSRRSHQFIFWLLVISTAALALRLWVGIELRQQPTVCAPSPATDMATYRALALDILAGNVPEAFYYQPFYYALFLPLLFGLLGTGAAPVIVAQSLLGAGTVWLTGLTGARLFGRRAGLLGALLLALARFHVFYTPYLLLEVLSGFLWMLTAWLVLHALRRNTLWSWGGAAITFACTVLTRGNAVLLLPGILLLIAWSNRRQVWARLIPRALLFLVLFYAPQLPFALRNYSHYGRWTGPSSAGEAVLALGNNPQAPAGGLDYTLAFKEWMRLADRPPHERVPVSRQLWQWIRSEPLAWAELKFRMLLLFWNPLEIPNNIYIGQEARHSLLLRLPLLLDFAVLGILGLTGAALGLRRGARSPAAAFLLYALAAACLGTVLFYILARFRVPALPLIALFAGTGLDGGLRLVEGWRRRSDIRLRAIAYLLALSLASGAVLHACPLYSRHLEAAVMRLARPHGVVFGAENSLVCQDHGPAGPFSGWSTLEVPRSGLRLVKDFQLPPQMQERRVHALVRLPLLAPEGGRLTITGLLQGRPQREAVLNLAPRNEAEPVVLELGMLSPLREQVRVELIFDPRPGPVFLLVDTHRAYGRTALYAAGAIRPQVIRAEACLDLLLVPPTELAPLPLPLPEEEDDDTEAAPAATESPAGPPPAAAVEPGDAVPAAVR
jgi:4-amino-4-deoxy-L-arabinose transferase-like glycosyltransferase